MAKRIVKQGVVVVRDGKRVRPQPGKAFDFTAEEIKQLEEISPNSIAKLSEVEDDPRSKSVEGEGAGAGEGEGEKTTKTAAKTTAAKKAAPKGGDEGL